MEKTLRLASAFFQRRDDVHETMRRIASRLKKERIDDAIVGGMAMTLHGYMRVTGDVDLLVTATGLNGLTSV
jgi:hypothetical protein